MPKHQKKTKINYLSIIGIILFLVVAGIILYGGKSGWFKFIINVPNQTLSVQQIQPSVSTPIYSTCSQLCSSNQFTKSYASSGTCKPGESLINYGYQNQPLILSCCCYNEQTCSASVDKTTIIEGEEITGTIIDGINNVCEIWMNKDNAGWIHTEDGITDANGRLVITTTLMAGSYQIYAKCGNCQTNTAVITSNPKPDTFCQDSCINSYFPGGRGPVNGLNDCNLQIESPLIQGFDGGTKICCCNHFDRIGCGRYGGSFGYTRNALVMPESTLNYCSEVAFSDCQSTGKTVQNYNLVSTCCMWNCGG